MVNFPLWSSPGGSEQVLSDCDQIHFQFKFQLSQAAALVHYVKHKNVTVRWNVICINVIDVAKFITNLF